MAFVSKLGNLLKQTVSKHINMELSASTPSLYQAIRCMSSSKLYVGGLPYATDEMSLREVFAQYGEVVEARIVMDRDTGRSRGFGFVNYASSDEASSAIQALDGKDFQGRWLKVNYAVEKPRADGFGGGYGGDAGYGYTAGSGSYEASGGYGSDTHGSNGNRYTSEEGSYNGGSGYGGSNYGSGNGNDGFGSGNYSGGSSFDGGNNSGYGGGSSSGNQTVASAGNAGGDNYFGGSSSGDGGYAGGDGGFAGGDCG